LICEADLSVANDPYLDDHVFTDAHLLPGVMALEAMAQVAMAVTGSATPPAFENVRLERPVIVPPDSSLTIRLAALVREDGAVEVVLRSAETAFQADHMRAVCRFGAPAPASSLNLKPDSAVLPLDPNSHLYGKLLFQNGRFRRITSYQHLRATECVAGIAPAGTSDGPRPWFNRYLPQDLALGDPGIRDAAIHAIQACIPHARVLPAGAAEIWTHPHAGNGELRLHACERSREGNLLVYDLEIKTLDGELVERWSGLELRIVGPAVLPHQWPGALLAPYLERRIAESWGPPRVSITLSPNGHANGILKRPDGKPSPNGVHVSRSHAGQLTLEVTSHVPVGCDCEQVTPRRQDGWRDLLGPDGFALAELIAHSASESPDIAATRVWCAIESLKKAGARPDAGLVLSSEDATASAPSSWITLRSGAARIATLVAPVDGAGQPFAFAILVGP